MNCSYVILCPTQRLQGGSCSPMVTNTSAQSLQSVPGSGPSRPVDWQYPLGLITTALFYQGAVTLSHSFLPSHRDWAWSVAIAFTFLWRFGVHKAGLFPWRFRHGERYSSYSSIQALAEGFAFFIFMLVLVTLQEHGVDSFGIILAAIAGLAYGAYAGWYSPPKSIS
jgi:hypothetical protein